MGLLYGAPNPSALGKDQNCPRVTSCGESAAAAAPGADAALLEGPHVEPAVQAGCLDST